MRIMKDHNGWVRPMGKGGLGSPMDLWYKINFNRSHCTRGSIAQIDFSIFYHYLFIQRGTNTQDCVNELQFRTRKFLIWNCPCECKSSGSFSPINTSRDRKDLNNKVRWLIAYVNEKSIEWSSTQIFFLINSSLMGIVGNVSLVDKQSLVCFSFAPRWARLHRILSIANWIYWRNVSHHPSKLVNRGVT